MKARCVIVGIFLFACVSASFGEGDLPLDTILRRTMFAAEKYNNLVESYTAEVYTRTYVKALKHNFLYKYTHFIPQFVLHDPKDDEALIETISNFEYDFPNNYVRDIKYVTGTLTKKKDIDMIPLELLHLNIYGETSNEESFFMPVRFKTKKYYTYTLLSTFESEGKTYYNIEFVPIYENNKLLQGSFVVENGTWRIVSFNGEGVDIFSTFSVDMEMGHEWVTNYLPEDFVIHQKTSYLGNVLTSRHIAHIDYKDIELRSNTEPVETLNISDFYRVRLDSVPVINDSTFWIERRPVPLQAVEKSVMDDYNARQQAKMDELRREANDTLNGNGKAAKEFAQLMVMNSRYQYKTMKIGYSGLLNPLMIGYSSRDGVTYRQKLAFNVDLSHYRTLRMNAFAGYVFNKRELITDLTTSFNYDPYRLGSVTLSVGNGTPTYSSTFVKTIQDRLDKQGLEEMTFDDISENYYNDYYLKAFNTYEPTNGVLFQTGLEYHIRKSKRSKQHFRSAITEEEEPISDLFGTKRSFAPFIRLSITPKQYYRYEGRQKIYVRSPYPTFKVELSQSIEDVLRSNSSYTRVEVDMSHIIPLGLMHTFQYHVGAGKILNQKTEYFTDFVYFARNNFPERWKDGLGGVFNLLNRDLFNASDTYVQCHLMLESPFLFLQKIRLISDFAEKERFYVSQLYTPQIKSYTELGYGIGNRFFNAGVFGSFHQAKFWHLGMRAAFEF
ncbi:MAG: DUF5686 family protein [Fermentimonas sp.]